MKCELFRVIIYALARGGGITQYGGSMFEVTLSI